MLIPVWHESGVQVTDFKLQSLNTGDHTMCLSVCVSVCVCVPLSTFDTTDQGPQSLVPRNICDFNWLNSLEAIKVNSAVGIMCKWDELAMFPRNVLSPSSGDRELINLPTSTASHRNFLDLNASRTLQLLCNQFCVG